jgi:hypothetical protein
MGIAKCRPVGFSGKADVLWEVTGACTTETAGVWVQTCEERFAEITTGRSIIQQGFATTCMDSWHKGRPRPGEDFGLAHEFEVAMREG